MAKLHFKYATMEAGKTLDLLRSAYNYEENNLKVLVLKPKRDTKADNKIMTRVGIERDVDFLIDKDDKIIRLLTGHIKDVKAIFVDESQFLTESQIDELNIISKALDIPVICYGLRTNFKTTSFEGSRRLLELADEISTFRSLCECGKIARFNAKKVNDEYVKIGEDVEIDGENDSVEYVPLCGSCYMTNVLRYDLEEINRVMNREEKVCKKELKILR